MALKRRALLQRAGLLAALGLNVGRGEAGFGLLSQRYGQALAQPARRKLALLVGINQYPESVCGFAPTGSALTGCLTDIELQSELLLHRFGFAAADIQVLSDQAATRAAIETAFLEHLVQQAAPGDLVVFHFSGLGSQVQTEGGIWQTSLVPIDGFLPTAAAPVVQDLMQETLALLLCSLPTQRVITVLDAGCSQLGQSLQGNLRIRSRPTAITGAIAEDELAFQAGLRRQTQSRLAQLPPGLMLRASAEGQMVAEAQWSGFSAGLFTDALTQQLWGNALTVGMTQAAALVQQTTGAKQQPVGTGRAFELAEPTAAGVIRQVEPDGRLNLWLAGLPKAVLENQTNSLFAAEPVAEPAAEPAAESTAESTAETEPILVQLRSRDGLTVTARGLSPSVLRPGQRLRELLRILPHDLHLLVAIAPDLERIERVDATSAFAVIPRITGVAMSDQPVDLLFGKPKILRQTMPDQPDATPDLTRLDSPAVPLSKGGYGLFDAVHSAIPGTLNPTAEAVKTAVARLKPQFKTRLANKLLQLTQNASSSTLKVRVQLNLVLPTAKPLFQQQTRLMPARSTLSDLQAPATLPAGGQIQYVLENASPDPVYFLLIGLNANGNLVLLYPADPGLAAGETRAIPSVNEAVSGAKTSGWRLQPTTGLAETQVIFSIAPFTQTAQVLAELPQFEPDQLLALPNPLEMAEAVLQDLHQASAVFTAALPIEVPAGSYALDVNAWAGFSFLYQVAI